VTIVYHSPWNRVVHRMAKRGSGWRLVVFWSFFSEFGMARCDGICRRKGSSPGVGIGSFFFFARFGLLGYLIGFRTFPQRRRREVV